MFSVLLGGCGCRPASSLISGLGPRLKIAVVAWVQFPLIRASLTKHIGKQGRQYSAKNPNRKHLPCGWQKRCESSALRFVLGVAQSGTQAGADGHGGSAACDNVWTVQRAPPAGFPPWLACFAEWSERRERSVHGTSLPNDVFVSSVVWTLECFTRHNEPADVDCRNLCRAHA